LPVESKEGNFCRKGEYARTKRDEERGGRLDKIIWGATYLKSTKTQNRREKKKTGDGAR